MDLLHSFYPAKQTFCNTVVTDSDFDPKVRKNAHTFWMMLPQMSWAYDHVTELWLILINLLPTWLIGAKIYPPKGMSHVFDWQSVAEIFSFKFWRRWPGIAPAMDRRLFDTIHTHAHTLYQAKHSDCRWPPLLLVYGRAWNQCWPLVVILAKKTGSSTSRRVRSPRCELSPLISATAPGSWKF